MSRTFVIGDIHGADQALHQCLERSEFDFRLDRLICLGDICDRRPGVDKVFDTLLKIRHLVMILGNHDLWALDWMLRGASLNDASETWLNQGGYYTISSYPGGVPESHLDLLRSARYYHVEGRRLFVHGGMDHRYPVEEQDPVDLVWDRTLVHAALDCTESKTRFSHYDEIFVGHTPTINFIRHQKLKKPVLSPGMDPGEWRSDRPLRLCNVWMMDTGAGWSGGRLSMMDIDSKTVFQSDILD